MTNVRHEWWNELRHGGMLIAPQFLDELLPELPPLDERAYDRLRAAWLKLDAALHGAGGTDEVRRGFAGELLEGFLGLGGWQKASAVGDQFKATAVTGEHLRPVGSSPIPTVKARCSRLPSTPATPSAAGAASVRTPGWSNSCAAPACRSAC